LDWGCGNGVHTVPLAAMGAKKVIGIDLSEKLLELGRAKARAAGMKHKIKFLKMDCEKTDFSENEFDVIFDGGTFSSVDIKTALPELARILKPDGVLIGIETFGHNPLANFNRSRNVKSGKRTAWAAAHIFNNEGIELAEKYFAKIEIEYFHFLSWLLIPLIGRSWGKRLFDFAEIFDRQFLKIPFLKKYAFKVVFEFSQPKNND
jgi:ubiquinone/menaquinone biosynthesis C-methylase UbiE